MTPITELERQNIANNKEKPVTGVKQEPQLIKDNRELQKMKTLLRFQRSFVVGIMIFFMLFVPLMITGLIGGNISVPIFAGVSGASGIFTGLFWWFIVEAHP